MDGFNRILEMKKEEKNEVYVKIKEKLDYETK